MFLTCLGRAHSSIRLLASAADRLAHGRLIPKISWLIVVAMAWTGPAVGSDEPPVPEFFGVYAAQGGSLVELREHPQSDSREFSIRGGDLLRSLSGIKFDSEDLQFVVYSRQAAGLMKVPALRIARVEAQHTLDLSGNHVEERERFDREFWHVTNRGLHLRVAPMAENPQMMVRLVPEQPLSPGIWGLSIHGTLYDFEVGPGGRDSADCLVRVVHITGVRYQPCTGTDRRRGHERSPRTADSTRDSGGNPSNGTVAVATLDLPTSPDTPCGGAPSVIPKGTLLAFGQDYDWTSIQRKRSRTRVHFIREGARMVKCAWVDESALETFSYKCDPPKELPLTGEMVICNPFLKGGMFSKPSWDGRIVAKAHEVAANVGTDVRTTVPKE